ncbi:MAG: T9SS type A sorting domain-containing protein [Flavobacteriales bacterium]|nr:T9SS type A sorting domain-containing protein [Flavobacteriales bacterium]
MRALLSSLLLAAVGTITAQPYSGTIFIDPDIITDSDPGTLVSVTYTGQGMVTVYDRRPAAFINMNAYLFDVVWMDGLTCVAMVNPEFGSVAAAEAQAQIYAAAAGQIPTCLRTDVHALWIHDGVYSFGGGNNSILIHVGRGQEYINDGILPETLVHEASHTSLDATHAASAGWLAAQAADPNFISTYAAANPTTEDVAESYLCWLAVRHRASRISTTDYNTILATIPNRLAYFDEISCDLFPITSGVGIAEQADDAVSLSVYPNPANAWIEARSAAVLPGNTRFELIDATGRIVLRQAIHSGDRIATASLGAGLYHWRCTGDDALLGSGVVIIE